MTIAKQTNKNNTNIIGIMIQSPNSWSTTSIDKFTTSQSQNQPYLKQLIFVGDTFNDNKQNLPIPGPYEGLDRGTKVPNPNLNIWLIASPTITSTMQINLIQSLLHCGPAVHCE